jgi:hypothetical protein
VSTSETTKVTEQLTRLSDLLDAHSPFELVGVLGMMHAIAVAPATVFPPTWLRLITTEEWSSLDESVTRELFDLLMALDASVHVRLEQGKLIAPAPDDVEGCALFADGYVTGAMLVPEWTADTIGWTLLAPYLLSRRQARAPSAIHHRRHRGSSRTSSRASPLSRTGGLRARHPRRIQERSSPPRTRAPRRAAASRPQRPVPVRVRQEVQALLRHARRGALSDLGI